MLFNLFNRIMLIIKYLIIPVPDKKRIIMNKTIICSLIILGLLFPGCVKNDPQFTFLVSADMRYTAKPEYRTSQYFQGACEAINKFGKGAFMIVPGDLDPPEAVDEVIRQVLGADYPWYPVVGNHELEVPGDMEYLRALNRNGNTLANITRTGPAGCEETTYAFEWADHHFVVLNQYYDGTADNGTDGDMVGELLNWLETDLRENTCQYVFVFGHEPLIAMPDMDNGRLRHQDDSLNKYPANSFRFHQLMKKYKVDAYICGHTHNASVAKINGIWQIDVGHARGIEDNFPEYIFELAKKFVDQDTLSDKSRQASLEEFYYKNSYSIKKELDYSGLTDSVSYKKLEDPEGLTLFRSFMVDFSGDKDRREQYNASFWQRANLARSTFLKISTSGQGIELQIYRDDARGGTYQLMHELNLN